MTGRTCAVDDCTSPHLARGMCSAHYQRWYTTTDEIVRKRCSVVDCGRPHSAHGYCANHAKNFRTYGTPTAPNRKGRNHPKWAGATPTYAGAHFRVRSRYGPPGTQVCADCRGPAREWAYDHLDAAELIHQSPKGPIPYSANPAHYMPMCKPCHTRFDRRARQLLVVA